MLLGRESGEDGNEAMDLIGGEEETAAVALPVEWERVGWGMDIVTGVGPSRPDEMVGRRAVGCGDVFTGEPEGATRFE